MQSLDSEPVYIFLCQSHANQTARKYFHRKALLQHQRYYYMIKKPIDKFD